MRSSFSSAVEHKFSVKGVRLGFGGAAFLVCAAIPFLVPEKHAFRPSKDVTYRGDLLLYQGTPLTGILEEHFDPTETIRKTHYKHGVQDGVEEETFENGRLAARRVFSKGKKVGTHEGWFKDGTRRFLHDFVGGHHHGEAWEWYPSGRLAMYVLFENGQVLGKKMWRETGQIYMNYVFPGGKPVGLPGTHLCYQVRSRR